MGECGPLYRTVGWHRELESFLRQVLMESDVAASLANDDPTVAPQRSDYLSV